MYEGRQQIMTFHREKKKPNNGGRGESQEQIFHAILPT